MKKLATFVFALLVAASLSFAQTGGSTDKGDKGKTEETGKKAEKGGKKGHKGGKKSKKSSGGTTTPPPK
ncbi:MAG TPA: hypothetical protein VKW06_21820 [Candidatus Angelobacter sp.]|nr:hypothetical protein [Candidatus Angelobacter sp.]